MAVGNIQSTVFLLWILGCCVLLTRGAPRRETTVESAKNSSGGGTLMKQILSKESKVETPGSPNVPVEYKLISKTLDQRQEAVPKQPKIETPGSPNVPVEYKLISKTLERGEQDTFAATDDQFSAKEDGTYTVLSEALMQEGDRKSRKECDDEDGCGESYPGSGLEDSYEEASGDNEDDKSVKYSVVFKTESKTSDGKDSVPVDAFLSDEKTVLSKEKDESVRYELVSKKLSYPQTGTSLGDVFKADTSPKKNEGINYRLISESYTYSDKSSEPSDAFNIDDSSDFTPGKENERVKYKLISKSTTYDQEEPKRKNCDDEEECGSADRALIGDEFAAERSPDENKDTRSEGETSYKLIAKEETSPDKECDDEDDCQWRNGGSGEDDSDTFGVNGDFSRSKYELSPAMSGSNRWHLFRGTSYLTFPPLGKEAQDDIEAELEILPLQNNGLLLYNGWDINRIGDFISLFLQDGFVVLSFDCRSGPVRIRSPKPIMMNEWNKITFYRSGRLGSLTLNDNIRAIGFTPEPRSTLILLRNLIVGGIPDDLRHEVNLNAGVKTGFMGYIRQLKIQGRILNMESGAVRENLKMNPCSLLPCKNGGRCVEKGQEYSCTCRADYGGKHCEQEITLSSVSFNSNSYALFNKTALLPLLQSGGGSMSFSVLTTKPKGMLMWEVQKFSKNLEKFASIGLTAGYISLSFNLGAGRFLVHSVIPVNDGEWHKIAITMMQGTGSLTIDDQHKLEFSPQTNFIAHQPTTDLFIGGAPDILAETGGLHEAGFDGCLKNFQVNSQYLNFERESIVTQGTGSCSET